MTVWRTLEEFESELLEDQGFRADFQTATPAWEIARLILMARLSTGMSQKDLAAAVGTSQSRISRWESGVETPRIDALRRVAEALGRVLTIALEPAEQIESGTRRNDMDAQASKSVARRTTRRKSAGGRKTTAPKSAGRKASGKTAARKTTRHRKTTGTRSFGRKGTGKKSAGRKASGKTAVHKTTGRRKTTSRKSAVRRSDGS